MEGDDSSSEDEDDKAVKNDGVKGEGQDKGKKIPESTQEGKDCDR